ncbi:hypothetical protein [Marinilactibacillus psychrotolerans]|uniref:hypothetical protein n=1 Tax=Marinilactibacillus psychrotolerans TaxID=191770 RepID=UPI0039AF21F1
MQPELKRPGATVTVNALGRKGTGRIFEKHTQKSPPFRLDVLIFAIVHFHAESYTELTVNWLALGFFSVMAKNASNPNRIFSMLIICKFH